MIGGNPPAIRPTADRQSKWSTDKNHYDPESVADDPIIKKIQLIIDDFGIEKITGSGASRLLDLIDERYGRGATIITSQVSLEAAPNVFSSQSPHVKEAIKDRMFPKNTILIELSGESKRGEADELRDGR